MQGGCLKCQSQTHCTLPHPHSPTHTVFYSVPSSSSGRVPCSIAQLCRAYFLCAFWSVWACQHTLWQCGVTRQHVSCSHRETLWTGWFTAQLFTPSCLFLWTPPSVFLNERLPLYLLSSPFSSALFLTTHSLFMEHPSPPPPQLAGRNEPSEAGKEGDWARPRHWQSSETQQGCEQLNIDSLWSADDVTVQGREEGKTGKRKTASLRGSSHFYWSIFSHGLVLSLFHLKPYSKSCVKDQTETPEEEAVFLSIVMALCMVDQGLQIFLFIYFLKFTNGI